MNIVSYICNVFVSNCSIIPLTGFVSIHKRAMSEFKVYNVFVCYSLT